jgi:hypothetical protein
MPTTYEWSHQCIDKFDDIIDHHFADKLSDLPDDPCCGDETCVKHDLELWRNVGNDIDGITDREYALVVDGRLPDEMDGGSRVPVRFHREIST